MSYSDLLTQRELCIAGQCQDCTTYETRIVDICRDAIVYFDNRNLLQIAEILIKSGIIPTRRTLADAFTEFIEDVGELLEPELQEPSQIPEPEPKKPDLVVFDIDGTALDDRFKGHKQSPINDLKRHEPVYLLYRHLIILGYKIVFLTGRLEGSSPYLIKNLLDEEYDSIQGLILCPKEIERTSQAIAVWKDLIRESLKQHFNLVAVIGDQAMDTEGIHIGDYQIRLPAPPDHQQAGGGGGCSMM